MSLIRFLIKLAHFFFFFLTKNVSYDFHSIKWYDNHFFSINKLSASTIIDLLQGAKSILL